MNIKQIQSASLRLRNNKVFELFVVSIIILSAVLIGAKTYSIPATFISLIKWLDFLVTIIFLFEISIRFIAEENKKKPLTDDKLSKILKEKGYPIARRTVAKYREQLELPVARLRKEI